MNTQHNASKFQPLGFSLARLRSAAAVAAALLAAAASAQAQVNWEGTSGGTPGDGFLWTDPLNWQGDVLPNFFDDVVFSDPAATATTILLNGNQSANSFSFTQSYTMGAYGTNNLLTDFSANISVAAGSFVTMNASYAGTIGLTLTGGGSLFLNNPAPTFGGGIAVDGAGSTLVYKADMVYPQYNGVSSTQLFGRDDWLQLGFITTTRVVTLTNGGVFEILGPGNNAEGNNKNILIGVGGGTLNLASGFTQMDLDDVGQLANSIGNTLTLSGKGRLLITGSMSDINPFAGDVVINGGVLDLGRLQGGSTTANTRFSGFTGTTSTTVGTNVLTINSGGVLMLDNGTVGNLDVATLIANDGAVLGPQGNSQEIGVRTQGGATPASTLQINGTVSMLHRDLLSAQTQRNFFINSDLTGSGILQILPSTGAASAGRLVIQRAVASTFNGTFRLTENANLELNPRANVVTDVGKLLADGDIEFAGWGSTLDLRDSDPAAANVKDYSTNEISITSTQNGSLNFLSQGRATTATGTGHMFNFGTLTMGGSRLAITANNGYITGLADTASITGNAVIEMRSSTTAGTGASLVFNNAAALNEDAAGRGLTLVKTGPGTAVAADVIDGGTISISNLQVAFGTLTLRGATGAITTGFGGAAPTITVNGGSAAAYANGLPTFGTLNLDSNGAYVVGATTLIPSGNNNDRIADSAILNMRSNSVFLLTSLTNAATTETIGTANVSGHASFSLVRNGTPASPVALTLTTLNLVGTDPTVNFTGTSLGLAAAFTTRIIIPGTVTGFMGAQFHSSNGSTSNDWVKYDNTINTGLVLGVTPFVAANYTLNTAETTWAAGQEIKYTTAGTTLTANRTVDRINLQLPANSSINLNANILTLAQGGILTVANTLGFIDTNAGFPGVAGGLTAGTVAPTPLYVHDNGQIDISVPIRDNAGPDGIFGNGDDQTVDFVKSGPGTVRLTHQSLGVGVGATAINPFVTPTWTSTMTGNWVINDGRLEVHRGQFLNGRPVILNGGQLEINQPTAVGAEAIIPGWGNNITVNGNAAVAQDNNGESADTNAGDRNAVLLGSLTINNGSVLGVGSFSDADIAFMGGTTINGRASFDTGIGRSGTNAVAILNGVLAGSGFDVVGYNGGSTLEIGGTQTDTVNNTYNGNITIYAGAVRMNKANGFMAITDGAATEDIIINGGTLAWGTGQHGDLATTNSVNTTNNGLTQGITPVSPAAIQNAGKDQIADTATITLLNGTLGEADRINQEVFGTLNQKGGTFNVGLSTIAVTTANISGGSFTIDRGATFKAGTLNLLPGAWSPSITTGIASPALVTTLEIGAGGLNMSGQNITLGSGSSGNVAGAGAILKLGGNVTVTSSVLVPNSYDVGIYIQTGTSFREIGASHTDLAGGVRDFNIASDVQFYVTTPLVNGGLTKSGGGALILEPYQPSTFAGAITVNAGVLNARGDGAFGTSAGGVTINSGGTVKLESSWVYGDAFTINGPGAVDPGDANVREIGALISDTGTNRITGAVILGSSAKIASNIVLDPSVTPASAGDAAKISNLRIESAGGVTGTGTLTLSGQGDGVILNGINTAGGGLVKDGAGRWTIPNASAFTGATTISAGNLRITNGAALGTVGAGTTVFGGALEFAGGISVAEPLTIYGDGSSIRSGALMNVSDTNTLTGAITLGGNSTIRSEAGSLILGAGAAITGSGSTLTLTGSGNGSTADTINLGAVAVGDALTKNGTGTWTLGGISAFTGSAAINGGTLVTTGAGQKFDPGSVLNFGGGSLLVSGVAQTVNGLNLLAGGSTVNGGAGLTVGTITRNSGASASFAGVVNAATSSNTNGILGAFATVGGDWAMLDGGFNVVAYSGYTGFTTAAATDNAITSIFQVVASSLTQNTLKISGGSGMDIGSNNIMLSAGGLIYTSSIAGGITGSLTPGILSGPTSGDELIVNVSGSGPLDIAVPLIGAGGGGLTKTGNGTLVLSGNSSYSGPVNINGGTLSIVGPGGTTHPTGLGTASGPRNLNINGGTFEVVGGDYNSGATNMYYVIGSAGATVRSRLGSIITIDDGSGAFPGQLSGSGDLTFTGGGRYSLGTGGTPNFPNFTGKLTVDGGILAVGNGAVSGYQPVGGRQAQTITVKSGSAIINDVTFGLGLNGLANNVVMESGSEMYAVGGSRVYSGSVQFNGTDTIVLVERDNPASERQIFLNGRVSGTGVTLNVFGTVNSVQFTPGVLYFAGGSNDITGTVNLNANTLLELRTPGSLGQNNGDVTVNLSGGNAHLNLRSYQNGDYHINVNASDDVEINSDRLVGFAGGSNQLLTINNLNYTVAGKVLTLSNGNTYTTRIGGTATFSADAILNASGNSLFENGLTFTGGATKLDKRGAGTVILRGPSDNTGSTIIQGGILQLQGAGTLSSTSTIELRGGELRIDNSDVANPDRLNNAATLILSGGVLRITGVETTLPTVTALAGTTQIISNPASDTVPVALNLTGFTRALGAVVQFQSPDIGAGSLAVGASTFTQSRIGSRITIPGQANVTGTGTIVGFLGNNSLDFIQYDGTTMDNGVVLGVRDMRNAGSLTSPAVYTDNAAETAWNNGVILHSTTAAAVTLTASRVLQAWKPEIAMTLTMSTFGVRIEGGGILPVGAATTISGTTGILTAGAGVVTAGTAELVIGGNNTLSVNAVIGNNATSGQSVALVKTGTSTLNLAPPTANTYTGGTYIDSGVLNLTVNNALGSAANSIFLNGGTLQFNIPSGSSGVALGGLGQNVSVNASSLVILDNGTGGGTNNSLAFGSLAINGPYILGFRGFDSMDATFTGTHTFTGTPTIDLPQLSGSSTPNTAGSETFITLSGALTGTGFFVSASGSSDNTQARLRIGNGDAIPNTYTGKVTLLQGAFNEDMFVDLNKAAGTTAITGDLQLDAGTVLLDAANQIADTSNIVNNHGVLNFNGQNETVASITMNGGGIYTNNAVAGSTPAANTVNITGALTVLGYDDLTDAAHPTTALNLGFMIGNNSTLNVGGLLTIGTYGRVHLAEGATAAVLNVNGGLQMTGALLSQTNGAGPNIVRLNSDVTTLAAIIPSNIGNSTDFDTFLELNGTRSFTVADGSAGLDLVISSVMADSTSPSAVGGFVKNGPGVMQIQGGGTNNSYTGPTTINAGTVVLFKNAGVNTLGNGSATNTLTIGDGAGGAKADKLILRNSEQIADGTAVTIASSGLLDLDTFNVNETVGDLTGAAGSAIALGPISTLAVGAAGTTVFSGSIAGGGTLTKQGAGVLTVDGTLNVETVNANVGTLNLNTDGNYATVNVNAIANFGVSQNLTALTIGAGGVLTFMSAGPLAGDALDSGAGLSGDANETPSPAVVPEPGSICLLLAGALGFATRRRRRE